MREELLIVGDFNIHVDSSNNEFQCSIDILNVNGLTQHVTSPIHQKGHTLDLVSTMEQSNLLSGSPIVFISRVSDANSSSSLDHYAVLRYLNVNRPKTVHTSVKFRAFRKIPAPAYQNDVKWFWIIKAKLQKTLMIGLPIIIQHYRIWQKNMLHYNVRKSHCDPIRPGTRVHYVGIR